MRATLSKIRTAELVRLDAWVVKNSNWLALGIIAAAFALRIVYSDSCYLNADEAMHFEAARPSSWFETYQASLNLAHPPLFILVLHGILFLGRTELILRLPSVVGGTVALWFTFAWIRRSFGETPALAGLGYLALSYAAISASTEVRQYGLLLCFVCGSLYATERTFSDRSIFWAIAQGFFLLAALLTHYTAVVVLVALGANVLLRAFLEGMPRRVILTISVIQLALASVLAWLYFGHVRKVIPLGGVGMMDYLRPYYYAQGLETPLGFARRAFSATFGYAVGAPRLAFLWMSVFLAGLTAILTGRTKAPKLTAMLLLSPVIFGFAAAIFRVFPFAGTRHQAYLLPFLAAGFSAALAWVPRRASVPLLLAGTVIVAPVLAILGAPDNDRRYQPMSEMTAAIKYVHQNVPSGGPLFMDAQTRVVLEYYLARNDANLDAFPRSRGVEEWVGGYRVLLPAKWVWNFRPDDALEQVTQSARGHGLPPGDDLWVISVAWFEPPWFEPTLASRLPAGGNRDVKEFGNISVIKLTTQRQ